jgi:hypothetical protein
VTDFPVQLHLDARDKYFDLKLAVITTQIQESWPEARVLVQSEPNRDATVKINFATREDQTEWVLKFNQFF